MVVNALYRKTMKIEKCNVVARLDGFMAALAEIDGAIRDFSSFVYLASPVDSANEISITLVKIFESRTNLSIDRVEELDRGLRDLELELREYILRDSTRESHSHFERDALSDRRKYLSFRIMDMIADILGGERSIRVFKAHGTYDKSKSKSEFFCVQSRQTLLVIQFNDDRQNKQP